MLPSCCHVGKTNLLIEAYFASCLPQAFTEHQHVPALPGPWASLGKPGSWGEVLIVWGPRGPQKGKDSQAEKGLLGRLGWTCP